MKQKAVTSRGGCEGGLAGTGGEASPWNLRHSGLGAPSALPILGDELGTPQPVAGGGTALLGSHLHSLEARSPQGGVPLGNMAAGAQPLRGPHPGQTTAASCTPRFCCPPPPGAPTQDPIAVPQPPRSHLAQQHLKLGLSAGGSPPHPLPVPCHQALWGVRRRQRGCGLGDGGAVLLGPPLLGLGPLSFHCPSLLGPPGLMLCHLPARSGELDTSPQIPGTLFLFILTCLSPPPPRHQGPQLSRRFRKYRPHLLPET